MSDDDLFDAFVLGFSASREGFNGEFVCDHLAPARIFDGDSFAESLENLRNQRNLVKRLRKLWEQSK